jgi:hypothetical protein
VSDRVASATITGNLGFLAVLQDAGGYLGGYLVTNTWGRPIEFRLTSAVQPNRVQHALYGPTLDEYLHADLIGKTLIEKTAAKPDLVIVSTVPALAIRNHSAMPIVGVLLNNEPTPADVHSFTHPRSALPLLLPQRFAGDEALIRERLDRVDEAIDLTEPFTRIQSAIAEHRKMGVTARAS